MRGLPLIMDRLESLASIPLEIGGGKSEINKTYIKII